MAIIFKDGSEIEKKQGIGKTTVEDKKGGTLESEEPVGDPVVSEKPMANVGLSLGYTKNLGNYESAKVTVSCHLPCNPDIEHMDIAFDFAESWTNDKMEKILQELSE